MQVASNHTGNRRVNVELVEKAEEALELARAFTQGGVWTEALDLYDDALVIFGRELGEAHPLTLTVQQEYSVLLTAQHLLAASAKRWVN